MVRDRAPWAVFRRGSFRGLEGGAADVVAPTTRDEIPLRSELFGLEQLQVHAKVIAGWHKLADVPSRDKLLGRLTENQEVLVSAYQRVTEVASKGQEVSPGGEWLIDNFYLIEEQIRMARRHLPRTYSRELPQLRNGPAAGLPRVYHIALELIAHLDGGINIETVTKFIASYQGIHALKIGELWAVPIMLRLALIENLRRIASRIALGLKDRKQADLWAGRLVETAEKEPANLILTLADMARSKPPLSNAFVAEFSRQLQGKSPSLAISLSWIEQRLAEHGQSVEQMIHIEAQQQSANQVSMGNSIASLRALSAIDWREFVEGLSVIEQTLRRDPSGIYPAMDFATRDHYRHAVEDAAHRGKCAEEDVAAKALTLAAHSGEISGAAHRTAHVGYYLVDKGFRALEKLVGAAVPMKRRLRELVWGIPLTIYLGLVTVLTLGFCAALLWTAWRQGMPPLGLGVMTPLLLLAMSAVAISLVNWLETMVIPPRMMPRMDFVDGIPADCQTMVVVPTMLGSLAGVQNLLERLEVHHLSNRDPRLYFAVLTDFKDAAQEEMPGDAELIQAAIAGIRDLNARYGLGMHRPFFLFHRPRRFSKSEGKWIGYERKRGKLTEFNALLRGGPADRFAVIEGDTVVLPSIHYVITLDTDTELPRDAARKLIATMAHPLIRARFSMKTGFVQDGYAILQPRVGVTLPSASRSLFVKVMAGEPGIDPYTRVVSDMYQDLFQEGSFIGKGIYDVDAFEKILGKRFPENRILSHDLLEGCYARAGVVSDVQLYEDHPWNFRADMRRRHRWIRGDWQIGSWTLPWVPVGGAAGRRHGRNPLSMLSRWKIFDNLRRSLVPAATLFLFMLMWLTAVSSGAQLFWTLVILAVFVTPALLATLTQLLHKDRDFSWGIHLRGVGTTLIRSFGQALLTVVFLPNEALSNLDAVIRTLLRVHVTRRRLLEWETAGDVQRRSSKSLDSFIRTMIGAPLLAIGAAVLLAEFRGGLNVPAIPLLSLWILAPAFAWVISQPLTRRKPQFSAAQRHLLRVLSRRTWRFFETFMGAEDQYLPPDNYQEAPIKVTAHRTSPTNIGLGLLSVLTAHDFGYIPAGDVILRAGNTLRTMESMARYRGHFYNWYDTRTLEPLVPLYVSAVDSGNLAASLMTFRQGLLALPEQPIIADRAFDGLGDMVLVLAEEMRRQANSGESNHKPLLKAITEDLEWMLEEIEHDPHSLAASLLLAERLTSRARVIAERLEAVTDDELCWASSALAHQTRALTDEMAFLAPWSKVPAPPDNVWAGGGSPAQTQQLAKLQEELRKLDAIPSLRTLVEFPHTLLPLADALLAELTQAGQADRSDAAWLKLLRTALAEAADHAAQRTTACIALAAQCDLLAQMDFPFLYDKSREQLAIGYNVTDHRRDQSYYDLLASEARLGAYVAIAQGQLPQESWFALGRSLTSTGGKTALLSWSGSMFEYLMPLLLMPTYDDTLLDHTYRAVLSRQVHFGQEHNVPWGVSESGYNMTDAHLNYQYRAFGVPGLGFKRGLADDLVIAPYATVMSLMVDPEAACANMERLAADGMMGRYGFYEAIDYTPNRVPVGHQAAVIRSFMSHHEAMSLLSLAYLLLGQPMQRRFLADPNFRATELLLQERVPRAAPVYPHVAEVQATESRNVGVETLMRVISTPDTESPEIHLLSNGRYNVMISNAGGGYSRWRDMAVTRWREDPTRDCWGSFCYIKDVEKQIFWSSTYQPTLKTPTTYEAIFQQARAEFRRQDGDIQSHTEISVSPEDDIEMRRVTLTNRSRKARSIEITSYAEVVIAAPAADASHPAFSNLFVQTEIIPHHDAILCTRRPRSLPEHPPWMFHLMAVNGETRGETSYETDRNKFIGRGRSTVSPAAMEQSRLSDSQGAVLDPIVAIRKTIILEAGESAKIVIVTGIAETRETAVSLMEKYHDSRLSARLEMAWTHSQVTLRQLNSTEADAQKFARLAGIIVHPNRRFRADPGILTQNRRGQSGLWGYSISGDLPIVLVRIADQSNIDLVRQLVEAHAYWRVKGLAVDLIIWNEDHSSYRQNLQDQIMGLISAGPEAHSIDRPGGVFVRRADQIADEDRTLMQAVARVIMSDADGTFADQVEETLPPHPSMPRLLPSRPPRSDIALAELPAGNLQFFNGLGGFNRHGNEYIITTDAKRTTPAPWVNVLANARLGTVVSESGSAYTWFQNAHECRLTPWSDDPVSDTCGEAFYIRDDETGEFWSPAPLPTRDAAPYTTRHGMGYSVFEHTTRGIRTELSLYVAVEAPVKFAVLKIVNQSEKVRQLSVAGYWEWLLGELRAKSLMHVVTEVDRATGAIFAHNPYNTEFTDVVAFVDVNDPARTITGDRAEFLGRNRSPAHPRALGRRKLSGRVGAGLDPCAALMLPMELADGQQREIVFIFGAGQNLEEARRLVRQYRSSYAARKALENVSAYWEKTLGAVHVETPDPAVDLLANGWLLYQTLACRMWARSGFYQSGGAFGFRDQLQDSMALVHAEPGLVREHLLRCARHQFREGDVQHWWHPPSGRGVRTHFSDDFLWLPLVTCRYVGVTGDTGVLDEPAVYLEGRPVKPDEEAYYDLPTRSGVTATLYEHCVAAINNGLKFGEHGLPLMGCGDWNDGMNLVGEHGKGESVWLAFFLHYILQQFADLARRKGDAAFADKCTDEAAKLEKNIEEHAWDGEWYRRAYFDNGEPLGSASNPECQIDSLPQSWSIIANAGLPERRKQAMAQVDARLVRRDAGIIQLFTPPFDKSTLNPGYIRGYLPGVRENGGQYTHAAVWTITAFALLGDHQRAWDLLTMINPVHRAADAQSIATYKVEPYVIAADVYGVAPHTGRGGWTWYTGSAGWMYRLIIETLLGLTREPERLAINPSLPANWTGFKLRYRFRETNYHITLKKSPDGNPTTTLDGTPSPDEWIKLIDDGVDHHVTIQLR